VLQRLAIALMIVSVVVIFASVPLAYWLSTHHEALALPTVVECDRGNDVVDVRVTSNRAHGQIERRKFAGCVWYWHEDPRPE
jgi:hypothetical protein